jgi:DNA-binding transcriptional MerR regulator
MEEPRPPYGLLTVGRIAHRTGLSTKALRHYDHVGLLRPAAVDPTTGYRFYREDQVAEARLVHLLRSVELPLDQVAAAVGAWKDGDPVAEILSRHRSRLLARDTRLRGALHQIDHLLKEGVEAHMSAEPDPAVDPTSAADAAVTTSAPAPAPSTATTKSPPGVGSVSDQRLLAAQLFNEAWRLMEQEDRTREDDDRMLHTAHASRYHWEQVPAATPAHLARGEWQISRVYTVLGRSEPALHHAGRVLDICREHGIGDWDLAFAYEALARAHAVAGDAERARELTDQALAAAEDIGEQEDRDLLLADLETIPGQPRYW